MLPEVAMDPNYKMTETKPQQPFWQQYLVVIGIDTVIVFIGSLILGDLRQMTNLYFWSTLILFIIAAVPVFTEIGTSAKIAGKALKDGEKVGSQLKEKQPTFNRGARITYLFGLAGITTFTLALLALSIG
jgi:uncharacterized membrane protein YhaH (DUF805 family)